jgi:D-cysteine desulfhydrase
MIDPIRLGTWPTPLEPAPRLATALGLDPDDLWIKRDDLSGLGGGGNKVRKLEWTCADALDLGADTLVTSGGAQSNHARLTAAAGARLGLDVVLVLAGSAESGGTGNTALDALFGARLVWAGDVDNNGLAHAVDDVVGGLAAEGKHPYAIPFGGSSGLAARGYVWGGHELLGQAPDLTTVVVALGSGGTTAGLIAALGTERVLAIDCGAVSDPAATVVGLTTDMAFELRADQLRLRLDQVGAGYSTLTEEVRDALLLAARTEGLALDPIYTGRALAGLAAAVRDGEVTRGTRTILLHSGGLPGFFGHAEVLRWARDQAR